MNFIDLGLQNLDSGFKPQVTKLLVLAGSLLESGDEYCVCNAVVEAGEILGDPVAAIAITKRIKAQMEVEGLEEFDLYTWANKNNPGLKMIYNMVHDGEGRRYRIKWIEAMLEQLK
jgi:hypothetical protein